MIIKLGKFHLIVLMSVILGSCLVIGVMTRQISVEASVPAGVRLPVIMYHHITEEQSRAAKYVVTTEGLENDFKYLKENGYSSVTVRQAADFAAGRGELPEKPVMITFDDGFESVYAFALPLLREYGFTAQAFVVGSICDFYTAENDHNLNYSYLTWEEIGEMSRSGLFEIQNHTFALHSNTSGRDGMKNKSGEKYTDYQKIIAADLEKNQQKIEMAVGVRPNAVAFPFGSYSADTVKAVRAEGFLAAFTCEEKVNTVIRGSNPGVLILGRFNRSGLASTSAFFEKAGI